LSKGYLCPKGVALLDLQEDPDWLRAPMRREGDEWVEVSWEAALDEAAARLTAIQAEHGRDAVALYSGNPTAHSTGALLHYQALAAAVGTRNHYSANSVDALPRLLTSLWMYGNQALLAVPDVDRTDFLLILGADPMVSNGSIMTAPDFKRRLGELKARGGRVVVIDPRRSRTAEAAGEHHFLRPGTDPLLLAAMLNVIFTQRLAAPGRLAEFTDGLPAVERAVRRFTPALVAEVVGIAPKRIEGLARDFAAASRACVYARVGTSVHPFGTTTSWLVEVLNLVTGNLDRPGGTMFGTGAVDLPALARRIGQTGSFGAFKSRVSERPEFNRELPVAALAEEIETPGEGQVRALLTHAGNPVLSTPEGPRLSRALAGLDFMVSFDPYLNETTRHAHLILPPPKPLERAHYPVLFYTLAVRNVARWSEAVVPRPEGMPADWQVIDGLVKRLAKARGGLGGLAGRVGSWALGALSPERAVDLLLRTGPHPLSLAKLRAAPHGVDLGPLEPRLPGLLGQPRIDAAPPAVLADLERVMGLLDAPRDSLVLVGRRGLRSNNSWMHNCPRLVRGPETCTLQMHPDDAVARGLQSGQRVRLHNAAGALRVPLEVTDAVMPGVVSLPHGWGHDAPGARLSVASRRPGVNVNALLTLSDVDPVSGVSVLNGVRVRVVAAEVPAPDRASE
jgi:anaerobic selenocysteine-containing dehydrogenase